MDAHTGADQVRVQQRCGGCSSGQRNLATNEDVGYVVIDLDPAGGHVARTDLCAVPATIRRRLLYRSHGPPDPSLALGLCKPVVMAATGIGATRRAGSSIVRQPVLARDCAPACARAFARVLARDCAGRRATWPDLAQHHTGRPRDTWCEACGLLFPKPPNWCVLVRSGAFWYVLVVGACPLHTGQSMLTQQPAQVQPGPWHLSDSSLQHPAQHQGHRQQRGDAGGPDAGHPQQSAPQR